MKTVLGKTPICKIVLKQSTEKGTARGKVNNYM